MWRALRHDYDAERSALEGRRSGSGREEVGPQSAGGRSAESASSFEKTRSGDTAALLDAKTPVDAAPCKATSYVPAPELAHA